MLFKLESSTALTCCSIPVMAKVSIIGVLVAKWAGGGWPLWSNELVSQLKSLVWLCSGLDPSLKDSYTVIWCIVCLCAWSVRHRLQLWPIEPCVGLQLKWTNKRTNEWMNEWGGFMWAFENFIFFIFFSRFCTYNIIQRSLLLHHYATKNIHNKLYVKMSLRLSRGLMKI